MSAEPNIHSSTSHGFRRPDLLSYARSLMAILLATWTLGSTAENQEVEAATPEDSFPHWFDEHIAHVTQGSGRWIASNAEYQSEAEPIDAYGIEWKAGLGNKSLAGRLFGLQAGQEVGTYWEFKVAWHPGDRKVYVYQFGSDGTFGVGPLSDQGGVRRLEQTFYRPNGETFRVGHDERASEGTLSGGSFDILDDGTWKPRRAYVWKLESGKIDR